jgi:ATP-binding cassette, subfamily B, bacterial
MAGDGEGGSLPRADGPAASLPPDVQTWLRKTLRSDEKVTACLFADIQKDGTFGERWTFLTNSRLMVLCPNGHPEKADIAFEIPLEEIEDAFLREYVASSALFVKDKKEGHEVVRFSFSSRQEAHSLCYCLKETARQRKEGKPLSDITPPPPHRSQHRCSKCGATLTRHSVCENCVERRRLIARLFSYLMPYKWIAMSALSLTLVMTGLQLVPPYLTKMLVDDVIGKGNSKLLVVIVGMLIGVYVGLAAVGTLRTYVMQWLGNQVLFDMRVQLFDHMQMLRLSYYNQNQTGQIMSRMTSDLQRLQQFVSQGFQDILVNIVTMFLIAGILLSLNAYLFLLALAPIPIIGISTYVFGQKMHQLYHRIWRRMGTVSAVLADTIPGIRVVKSFTQEERESDRFGDTSQDLLYEQMRAAKLSSAFFPFLGLMSGLGVILTFSVGAPMVIHGVTTLGVLMAFTPYLWQFYAPVQRFGDLNHQLQHCVTSAERVFEILDTDVEPLHQPNAIVLKQLKGEVEFRDVHFSYEPGKYALDGVSFKAVPGEMIGLVGPSGAGKSTLVHLLARFYDVDEGQILIDGYDVEELSLHHFRQQIGVVLQEPYLFYGTIWANIAYANPDASADEIVAASRAANAHEFIVNLPDGYDTMVAERGQTLSGGERQRISIARAILRNPRILILDEATASVDTETEMMIQTALERLVENRTTFAIAHRLTTLRKASRLMVLERGKIAEIGTHEELIKTGGLYSRLCQYQADLSKVRAW